jgi:hypothetical protein
MSHRPASSLARGIAVVAGLLALIAAPAIGVAAPRPIAVLPPSGDNIAPAILGAARDILKEQLHRSGAYAVIEPTGESSAAEIPPAQAAQLAATVGADQALALRITHYGRVARLALTSYAAGTGQVIYWDSITLSSGPDELDTAIARLVHGLVTGKPVRDSAELETVTEKETQQLNRRNANRAFGVHLLALLPFNTPGDFSAVPGGGIFWLYDARSWMADIALDLGGQSGRAFYDVAIGAYYPFLREDFTPYLGAVVRWAYMDLGGQGAGGLTFQPTLGMLLGRLSSTQLRAEVGYFFNTFGEREGEDLTNDPRAPKHYSYGVLLTVGIGF